MDGRMDIRELGLIGATLTALLLLRRFRRDPPQATSVEPWVIEAFQKKKRQQWLLGIPVGVVWFFSFRERAHPSGSGETLLFWLALAITVWACVFTYRNWRCPKCGAYLGKYAWQRGVCPKCGTALCEPSAK